MGLRNWTSAAGGSLRDADLARSDPSGRAFLVRRRAEVVARVMRESGELDRLRREAEESRRVKVPAARRVVEAPKTEAGSRHVAGTSTQPPPSKTKTEANKNGTAAKLAKVAGVSQRTMERPCLTRQHASVLDAGTGIQPASKGSEMKTTTKTTRLITEETWKKLHDAYVAPTVPAVDYKPLEAHARRFRVPLAEAEHRATMEEWDLERQVIEAREYFREHAPGIKTEVAFCLQYAAATASCVRPDLGTVGGEGLLEDLIADARVIWRKRMSPILLWEAMQASPKYLKRVAPGPTRQRARTPHGRAEGVA